MKMSNSHFIEREVEQTHIEDGGDMKIEIRIQGSLTMSRDFAQGL